MREGKVPLRTVLENFINHVDTLETKRSEGNDQYEVEFQELKQLTESLRGRTEFSCSQGENDVNRRKNRYKDILPYFDDDIDEGEDYETAIIATDYGPFQYWLILIGGFANASDAIEILCVSILLPAAECDLHMSSEDKGWLSAIAFIGMMVGGYVWGCLGDIYGRRNILMVSLMLNGLSGLVSSVVQTFPAFLVFRFISGLGVGGSIPLVWAYVCEFQPPDKRGSVLSIIASFWMIGNVLVAVFALVTIPYDIGFQFQGFTYNSWRVFLTICALPAIIIALVMLWLPESPMFLLIKDRREDALTVLQKVYALNTGRPAYTYPSNERTKDEGGWREVRGKVVRKALTPTPTLTLSLALSLPPTPAARLHSPLSTSTSTS